MIVPGDVVHATRGWAISKFNRRLVALGSNMGNDLLVLAVDREREVLCVLSRSFGPVWVNIDDRTMSVVR